MEHIDENANANKNVAILIKTPNIPKSIFINIKNLRPSRSKVNIIPGNFTDHEAIAKKLHQPMIL